MLYLYDMLIMPNDVPDKISRYGMTYKREQNFNRAGQKYYSFICPGMEKILVIPGFIIQYRELEQKLAKFAPGRSFEAYVNALSRLIEVEDSYQIDDQGNMLILAVYKDIAVTINYWAEKKAIELSREEFEIRDHNIFGNGITVSLLDAQF